MHHGLRAVQHSILHTEEDQFSQVERVPARGPVPCHIPDPEAHGLGTDRAGEFENLGQVTREPPCQTLHAWGSQNQRPPRRWAQGARPGNQAQDLPQAHSWGSWAWHPPRRWARGPGPGSLCPRGHLSPGAPEPSTHHTVRMKIPAQTAPGSTGTAAPRHHKSGIHCAGGPKCPGQATWAQGSPCR